MWNNCSSAVINAAPASIVFIASFPPFLPSPRPLPQRSSCPGTWGAGRRRTGPRTCLRAPSCSSTSSCAVASARAWGRRRRQPRPRPAEAQPPGRKPRGAPGATIARENEIYVNAFFPFVVLTFMAAGKRVFFFFPFDFRRTRRGSLLSPVRVAFPTFIPCFARRLSPAIYAT